MTSSRSASPVRRSDSALGSPCASVGPSTFTRAQIEAYNKKFPWSLKSAPDTPTYIIIHNKVYDIAGLVNDHPGGAVILTYVGRDGSDAFDSFHPESTTEVLADYYVGDLVEADRIEDERDFAVRIRKLKEEFAAKGLYESNKLFFLTQFSILATLIATALFLLYRYPDSTIHNLCAGALTGLFWQQCGWLSHDFLHHAVFKNRDINNSIGYFLGGVCQGFSVHWWKDKHNTHHAQPNVHGEDPDIDTMPLLAWSEHALELFAEVGPADVAESPRIAQLFVPRQAILYFPILAVARISWALQSALYVTPFWKKKVNEQISLAEQLSIVLHWSWYLGVMVAWLSPLRAILFFAASQAFCGLFLATVFSLNHNGMAILSQEEADRTDFYTKQILTGRDVHQSLFMNWFCGGLNFQIEHHLFPNMPRHSYSYVKPIIQSLCKEHNIPYHATGFWEGTWEVLARLQEISDIAIKVQAEAKAKAAKVE